MSTIHFRIDGPDQGPDGEEEKLNEREESVETIAEPEEVKTSENAEAGAGEVKKAPSKAPHSKSHKTVTETPVIISQSETKSDEKIAGKDAGEEAEETSDTQVLTEPKKKGPKKAKAAVIPEIDAPAAEEELDTHPRSLSDILGDDFDAETEAKTEEETFTPAPKPRKKSTAKKPAVKNAEETISNQTEDAEIEASAPEDENTDATSSDDGLEDFADEEDAPVIDTAHHASSAPGVQITMFRGEECSDLHVEEETEPDFDKEAILKKFHRSRRPINHKVERFSPKLNEGLTSEEVKTRFNQFLFNDTRSNSSRSYLSIFVSNICTFFNLLCLIATVALIIAGTTTWSSYLVIIITLANIILGIVWEIRSKKAIGKLQIMAHHNSKVVRDGEVVEVPTTDIVLDDVIVLELGNQVPTDCILAEGSVEVNEALLTGESEAVKKSVGDTLYAGSYISSGTGKFRVEKVGDDTYLSKLTSKAKKYKKPNSEIMNSTKLLIRIIAILIIPIAIGIFIVTRNWNVSHELTTAVSDFIFSANINDALQRTAAVVIGMIPSGMILLTTLALSMGVIRLARHNTMVQDLYSLEMLARVNVLCLDKTGTITDGRMQVKDSIILNTVDDYSLDDIIGSMLRALEDNNQTFIALYNHFGYSDALTPRQCIHFSSKRKLSAVTFAECGTFCIGAPEFVLKPYPQKVEKIVKQYAQMGLRVVVLAYSPQSITGEEKLPSVMRPIAIISIADNIREEAVTTLKWFRDNEVQVKVISGDNPITVAEVAKRAGIQNADKFISLEGLNDKEVENVANKYNVFGRVTPEQKAILIRSMKSVGNTVAMTGDGVNDILAMKESDCSIALASGSEAASNVSHLVLLDNNFASMPKIVAEGRRVINNIKSTASMYLTKTLFTTLLAFICICMGHPYIFNTQNLLIYEIFVTGLPTFFLSLQPNTNRVQGKFMPHVLSRAVSGAVVLLICVMGMYIIASEDIVGMFPEYDKAMCMLVISFTGFVILFRNSQPMNLYRWVTFLAFLALTIGMVCIPALGELTYTGWKSLEWTYEEIITIVVIVVASIPISSGVMRIMEFLVPSSKALPKNNKSLETNLATSMKNEDKR
ncbi:MAG: HAD-IC family P-type ATPase [Clostridia bacterium]|nr:HAD-IC family P-type ATPase [Clostridia bacterium]